MTFHRLVLAAASFAFLTACSGSTEPPKPTGFPVSRVELSAPVPYFRATHSITLTATALDAVGSPLANPPFTWTTSDAGVATVNQSGVVTGVSAGSVTITASLSGKAASVTLEIQRAPLASISLTVGSVTVGTRVNVRAIGIDSAGKTDTLMLLEWKSSTPGVATIQQNGQYGLLTPLAPGTTLVEANREGISGSMTITVSPLPSIRFKSLSAHTRSTCGIAVDGKAFCWGADLSGSLGNGIPPIAAETCTEPFTISCNSSPLPVGGDHVFSFISEDGLLHHCAIASDGAYCWGTGTAGELGNGTKGVSHLPVKVQSSSTYTSINAGRLMTCGLTTSHKVECWGQNLFGELGDTTSTEICPPAGLIAAPVQCSTTPRPIASSLDFYKLAVGWSHACALTKDGAAYCWGYNGSGGIGAPATAVCGEWACNRLPTAVATDVRFTDIAAGAQHTCAISTTGRAYCWGENGLGQSGTGSGRAQEPIPVPVSSTTTFAKIISGDDSVCGLDATGAASCWGFNSDWQLADGTNLTRFTPVQSGFGLKFTSLTMASFHSCGIATDGYAYCWGLNTSRQLGIGRSDLRATTPTRVANQ